MSLAVLDLFSGTGSATKPFEDLGFKIISVDINPNCDPTFCMSIIEFKDWVLDGNLYDFCIEAGLEIVFVWASPDCKNFSLANVKNFNKNWYQSNPIGTNAFLSLANVAAALEIIEYVNVDYWVMENPRAMLRTVPMMGLYPRRTVSYCQYGDTRMKPTDLWGHLPVTWKPKICSPGDKCHEPAPRGSKSGTQNQSYKQRIVVPYGLGESIAQACIEHDWERPKWVSLNSYDSESL